VKDALELLEENKLEEVALLLLDYYDKAYLYSKNKYKKQEIARLEMLSGDPAEIADELIKIANQLNL
jgi:tRNA 2-selenouridine synthase